MAIYEVEGPGGVIIEVEGPDNADPARVVAEAQRLFAQRQAQQPGAIPVTGAPAAPPAAPQRASTIDVITSAPYKAVAGAADILLTAPQNIANLAKMAYGTAATAMGRPELAPEVTPPRQPVAEALQRVGLIREPQGQMTTGQRMLDVGIQGATGALLGGAPTVGRVVSTVPELAKAAGVMGTVGTAAGLAGQATTEATGSPLTGAAVSMAVPGLTISAAQARQSVQRAEQQRNAVRDLTIRRAQEEGYLVTPGSVTPKAGNVMVERLGGKTRTQQEIAVRNQDVTDKLARRALGIAPTAPLGRGLMRQIRADEFQKGYEPINRIGTVRTDADFNQSLDDVLAAYTGPGQSFPGAIPQPVVNLVQGFRVGQFDSKDALQATRTLRAQADANIRSGGDNTAVGLAQRAISNAIEDQLERALQQISGKNGKALLDQFRASRQRMAVSHAVEDAIVEGGGSVNARQLANDLQTRGRYFSGDLDLIARFANISRPVMVQPGTQGTPGAQTLLQTGAAGLGGLAGYGVGGGAGAGLGAAAGALFPQALSAAARAYLRTPFAQKRAVPTYERPGVNALAASNEELLRAMMAVPTFTNQPAPPQE